MAASEDVSYACGIHKLPVYSSFGMCEENLIFLLKWKKLINDFQAKINTNMLSHTQTTYILFILSNGSHLK